MITDNWLDTLKFDQNGLLPAIAQDVDTGKILMMAWMNREALKKTAQTKTAVYFSRSRGRLWHKGERSGHTQLVQDIFIDCDADVVLLKVIQIGNIACHTGRQSCFYRKLDLNADHPAWQTIAPVVKDPTIIYANTSAHLSQSQSAPTTDKNVTMPHNENIDAVSLLQNLDKILTQRKLADADSSYVASLYAKGINKLLEKVGEESIEVILAAKELSSMRQNNTSHIAIEQIDNQNLLTPNTQLQQKLTEDLIYEVADLWFHTLVTLAWFDVPSNVILKELARRFGLSGITEKASRRL